MKNRYLLWIIIGIIVLLFVGLGVWWQYGSATRIALVNFPGFQSSGIILSNSSPRIKYSILESEEVDKFKRYDYVLVFGMGLAWDETSRARVVEMTEKGFPLQVIYPTTPENMISGLDSLQTVQVVEYIDSGGKNNFQNFAYFIRKYIDKKRWYAPEPEEWQESPSDCFYHIDEEVAYEEVKDFEAYLKRTGLYHEGAPKVLLTGGVTDPYGGAKMHLDSLILALHRSGLNVYPITTFTKRLQFIEAVAPDLIIYLPHGRLAMGGGERSVELLKRLNVPLLAPLKLIQSKEAWREDPMGMLGGFLSQSVVTPEMDGALYPYALFSEEERDGGYSIIQAIPHRLAAFTELVHNFLKLRRQPNREKRIAIYYYKGPGHEALSAQGLETVASLHNILKYLQSIGYNVEGLPSVEEFRQALLQQGEVFESYDQQSAERIEQVAPAAIPAEQLAEWIEKDLDPDLATQLVNEYGKVPGTFSTKEEAGKSYLLVPRIVYGNIALIPQPLSGTGTNHFQVVHGADMPPPYPYVGAYLWARNSFHADAIMHFGTHGSLEFTPEKQVALGDLDWGDQLIGVVPHFYYYTIGNVGEGIIAKRRSYAQTITYLTPPFSNSGARGIYAELQKAITNYFEADNDKEKERYARSVKQHAIRLGVHRDLRLDTVPETLYSEEEILRIDNYAEEIASEKISGTLYTAGQPYSEERLNSTVVAMVSDPIAYGKAKLDNLSQGVSLDVTQEKRRFNQNYLQPSQRLVEGLLRGRYSADEATLTFLQISKQELEEARHTSEEDEELSEHQEALLSAYDAIKSTLLYRDRLKESPTSEMASIANALAGGYTAPTSGGDAVANPSAVPTGRNLYSINAEATPSQNAWKQGVHLVQQTIAQYQSRHDGGYPNKVSYTFWSSEFIESEGTTLAQVFYLLGVEPIWDSFGRVNDLRLIPSHELGRPRIDVVVQTSGQFRDIAASRLALVTKAIEMAAEATNDGYDNLVHQGVIQTEALLVEAGVAPKAARELSTKRVFGGINGMYGTGIQEMIEASDAWESEAEIAEVYLNNMGASYATVEEWGAFSAPLFKAALANTDVVMQPRQSNSWGALSLDHVYEFMGGLTLTIRHVTGKDPDTYFSDYRNKQEYRIQDLKEAIGIESRTTILNPTFVKEMMSGGASNLSRLSDIMTNTFGWNVAKPEVIDDALWDEVFEVYIKDKHNLGVVETFEQKNPHALQETTTIMLESARKGLWSATPAQTQRLAEVYTDLVTTHGEVVGGMGEGNTKLKGYIVKQLEQNTTYKERLTKHFTSSDKSGGSTQEGIVMKKEEQTIGYTSESEEGFNGIWVALGALLLFIIAIWILKRKRR